MKYKILITFIALNIAGMFSGFSQVYERTRHESRSFKVYDQTSLEVYNKYGNIHLFSWDKDSVKIDIDLTVKASKKQKADKIFEFIDFEFSDSKFYVIARTTLSQNQGSFWAELSDLANTVFSGNNKTQINYNIYLPRDMSVQLENKFGNIYCTDHDGKIKVTLSNGDFKANNLTGEADLEINFGNAGINYLEKGNLKSSYLDLDLGSSLDLKVESKSSTFNIEKIRALSVQSRRDKFYIGDVNSLIGESSFSYFTLKGLSRNIKVQTEYGELKMKGIDPGFNLIDLDSKYTDIIINISQDLNCFVDVTHTEATGIYYPDHLKGLTMKKAEKKDDPFFVTGFIGEESEAKEKIKISIQSGKVMFQEEIQMF